MVRQDAYRVIWIGNFFINFCLPILFLMTRDAKRKPMILLVMGCILFLGHWIDVYQMVTPGVVGAHGHIGWMEVGTMLGFLGLFRYVVLNQFAKAPAVAKNDPFLQESLQHSF
jgi:sugar phosphate permease